MFAILFVALFFSSHCITSQNINENCSPGSLDKLDISSLLRISINSTVCFFEARNVFNRTYSRANFFILPSGGGIDEYKKQSVRIGNFDIAKVILKTFGDFIQLIDLSFGVNETENIEMIKVVNENGINFLTQLHLRNCIPSVLDEFNKPYLKVKTATFSTNLSPQFSVRANGLRLDELFPQLKRLDLKIATVNDWDFVGNNFPNLRSLSMEFPGPIDFQQIDFEIFFKNSSNINSLRIIDKSTLNFLKAASDFLPKLSNLEIWNLSNENYDGDDIQFKNVCSLSMTSSDDNELIPHKLIFTQLQVLSLSLSTDFTDQWITFFENQSNKTIEFFYITANSFTESQLMAIAENQPNIKLAMLRSKTELSAEMIVGFIEKSKKLFSLNYYPGIVNVSQQQILQEKLQNEWSIKSQELLRLQNIGHILKSNVIFVIILILNMLLAI